MRAAVLATCCEVSSSYGPRVIQPSPAETTIENVRRSRSACLSDAIGTHVAALSLLFRSAMARAFRLSALAFVLALAAPAEAAGPKGKVDEGPSFDRAAAATALASVDLAKCKATNAKRGEGHVTVTFAPAGSVASALVDKGPMAGTPVAKCIQSQYSKAKVPAFRGEPVAVGKTFRFE